MEVKQKLFDKRIILVIAVFIIGFLSLLLYQLGTVPKMFVDEQSYMYEIKSLLFTGSDLNNLVR